MKTLVLAALAPLALLAVPAAAQTTVQRTVSTPAGSVTTTRTSDHMRPAAPAVVQTTRVRTTITHRTAARTIRQCSTHWRNHRRVRVCRTVRIRG